MPHLLLSETGYAVLAWSWIAVAVPTAVALLRVTAPFGRHLRSGWGPLIPARLAWLVMESPAIWWVGLLLAVGDLRGPATLIAGLWFLHYGYRVLIYPFRLNRQARPLPLSIAAMAFFFQLVSGLLIASRLAADWGGYPDSWWIDPRLGIGVVVMIIGAWINHRSDAILRDIGRGAEGEYGIPRGFLYERVSCPNYLGEIIEWIGFAIAGWSLAGVAFAIWTCANLLPRALAHHHWYQNQFEDYPSRRRALVPGVL